MARPLQGAATTPCRCQGSPRHLPGQWQAGFEHQFDAWLAASAHYQGAPDRIDLQISNFNTLMASDAVVLSGTDAGSAGHYHDAAIGREIRAWQDAGLSFAQVIESMTSVAAERLGMVTASRKACFPVASPTGATATRRCATSGIDSTTTSAPDVLG